MPNFPEKFKIYKYNSKRFLWLQYLHYKIKINNVFGNKNK